MDCDDEFLTIDVSQQIVKEAKSVYNQLKMLHMTLNSNHDGDSGKFASNYFHAHTTMLINKVINLLNYTHNSYFLCLRILVIYQFLKKKCLF